MFELTSSIAAPFALALVLSLVLVPITRAVATRLGYVAKPREDRWHKRPVAMFGGVAIAASVFAFHLGRELAVLAGAAATMFIVGLVDDVISLKPSTKLIAQIACASML